MKINLLDILGAMAIVFIFGWTAYFIFFVAYNAIRYIIWNNKKTAIENARRAREMEMARYHRIPHARKPFDYEAFCAGR